MSFSHSLYGLQTYSAITLTKPGKAMRGNYLQILLTKSVKVLRQ